MLDNKYHLPQSIFESINFLCICRHSSPLLFTFLCHSICITIIDNSFVGNNLG